jgi:hypothetical protein
MESIEARKSGAAAWMADRTLDEERVMLYGEEKFGSEADGVVGVAGRGRGRGQAGRLYRHWAGRSCTVACKYKANRAGTYSLRPKQGARRRGGTDATARDEPAGPGSRS